MEEENEELFSFGKTVSKIPTPIGRIRLRREQLVPRVQNELFSVDDSFAEREELFNSVADNGYHVALFVESPMTGLSIKDDATIETLKFTVIAGHRRLQVANDKRAAGDMLALPCVIYPPLTESQREELDSLSNISRILSPWQAALRWYRLKKLYSSRLKSLEDVREELGKQIPGLQAVAKIPDSMDSVRKAITVIREIERLFPDNKERALEIRSIAASKGWIAAYKTLKAKPAEDAARDLQSESIVTGVIVDSPAGNSIQDEEIDVSSNANTICVESEESGRTVDALIVDGDVVDVSMKSENIPEIVPVAAPTDAARNLKSIKSGLGTVSRTLDCLEKAGVNIDTQKKMRIELEQFVVDSFKKLGWST